MSIIPTWASHAETARIARTNKLPGYRPGKQIAALRKQRAERNATTRPLSLAERLDARILATYVPEIEARGGEIEIHGKTSSTPLRVIHRARQADGSWLYLLGADGWRYYSSRVPARFVSLRYLVGQDDNGAFAARVFGTIERVSEAIAHLTPAAVNDTRGRAKKVRRQGDVYALETTPANDTPTGWVDREHTHWWDAETRHLIHKPARGRKHRPARLIHPVRFVQQRAFNGD